MSERNTAFRAPFNVVATFGGAAGANVAVDALATRGIPLPAITLYQPDEAEMGGDGAGLDAGIQDGSRTVWCGASSWACSASPSEPVSGSPGPTCSPRGSAVWPGW